MNIYEYRNVNKVIFMLYILHINACKKWVTSRVCLINGLNQSENVPLLK